MHMERGGKDAGAQGHEKGYSGDEAEIRPGIEASEITQKIFDDHAQHHEQKGADDDHLDGAWGEAGFAALTCRLLWSIGHMSSIGQGGISFHTIA